MHSARFAVWWVCPDSTGPIKEGDIEIEGFVNSVFRYFYRRRQPSQLESRKPRFKWMPKYTMPVRLPDAVVAAEKPSDELDGDRITHNADIQRPGG